MQNLLLQSYYFIVFHTLFLFFSVLPSALLSTVLFSLKLKETHEGLVVKDTFTW